MVRVYIFTLLCFLGVFVPWWLKFIGIPVVERRGGQKEHEAGGRHNGARDREKSSSRIINIRLWRLPGEDSNLGTRLQRPMCYHYTTGQDIGAREGSAHYAMLGSLLGSKINAGGVNLILFQ